MIGGLVVPPDLADEPLVEDEVVLVGPPALGGRRLKPCELSKLTWIYREEGSAMRDVPLGPAAERFLEVLRTELSA